MENHDVRVLIVGMGCEVAFFRRIPILVTPTTNRDDLHRAALLEPLFDLINRLGEPADE